MNLYRYTDTENIEIETDVNRVKSALIKFGAECIDTKLVRSHIPSPEFSRHTSKIVSYAPQATAAVRCVFRIGSDNLNAVKAILSDLGVELELGRD